jgi:hypothetical protein
MLPALEDDCLPDQIFFIVARCLSRRLPRPLNGQGAALKSSGLAPMAMPSVRRPPERASSVAACFASTPIYRSGARRMVVISPTLLVIAAVAARVIRGS